MTSPSDLPPRIAVRGIGFGLVLMAFFTVAWAADAPYGWSGVAAVLPPVLAVGAAGLFLVRAIQLFRAARR